MEIVNQTEFEFAPLIGRIGFPGYSLTLVVKGTFGLVSGEKAIVADEQLFPDGDEFYPEDEEMKGGTRYSTDFAYFKPHADLLFVGKCFAPEGTKVPARQVTFQVGSKTKTLNIFGNRHWKRGLLGYTATDPEPFAEMELRYENSFGGKGYKKNPVGKGIEKIETDSGKKVRMLPNIVNPDDQILSPGSRPEPTGFGPLGLMWTQRFSKLGSYKADYLKKRWPWFPNNFDWSFFNTAPSDMQVKGFLKGDETLYFENLHPDHPQYNSQLPCLRVRCFLEELDEQQTNHKNFREVLMNLDTLWVDMKAEKLALVWRGFTQVKTEDYEEIQHVFIVSENIAEPTQSVDYYQGLFSKFLIELEKEEEFEIEEPKVVETEESDDVDEEIAKADAEMRASLIEAGIDPDSPPKPTPEQKAEEAKIFKDLGFEKEPEEQPLTPEIIQDRINRGESFKGEDLRGIDLSGLDMQRIDFEGVILSGVILKKTNLTSANLTRANLAGADLTGAKLNKATLNEADFTGTLLVGSDLSGANLNDTIFEKTNMQKARLDQTKATNANFSQADLTGASLKESNLEGADFSNCILNKANFQGSNLREASLTGAVGILVNLSETDLTELRASEGCNFTHGSFQKAIGFESIWENAVLNKADFSYSNMEGADFSSASLEKATVSAADMKFAKFTKANLKEARFLSVNLFHSCLEKADLTGADFSGSNLYGVEFLESIIVNTKFEFANLKMTELSNLKK